MTTYPRATSAVRARSRGFSLVELLVVVGILVGLIAIITPMVVKARKTAARTRQASDLQAIAAALEAFKADQGDYPRPFAPGAGFATLGYSLVAPGPKDASTLPSTNYGGRVYEPGEIVLQGGVAYVAIARTSSSTTTDSPVAPPNVDYWAPCPYADYADGPGFRLRPQGQVFGPYLQPDRFKLRGYAVLDQWGNPILYSPARAGSVNVNNPASYYWDIRDTSLTGGTPPKPLYDYTDNICMFGGKLSVAPPSAPLKPVQKFLGDKDQDGKIGPGESPVTTSHYILWSAGADAEGVRDATTGNVPYGLDSNDKTDDVTNFEIDGSFLK